MKVNENQIKAFIYCLSEQFELECSSIAVYGVCPVCYTDEYILDNAVFLVKQEIPYYSPSYRVYTVEDGKIELVSCPVFGYSLHGAIELYERVCDSHSVDFENFFIYGSAANTFTVENGVPCLGTFDYEEYDETEDVFHIVQKTVGV